MKRALLVGAGILMFGLAGCEREIAREQEIEATPDEAVVTEERLVEEPDGTIVHEEEERVVEE